ncbi:MAG: HD-GYP domain-containing protein [Chloroflexota bacterium]
MASLRPQAQIYLWAVILTAAALLAWQLDRGALPTETNERAVLIGLLLCGILADGLGINLHAGYLHRNKVTVSLSASVTFAATLLFGPLATSLGALIASIATDLRAGRAWYKVLFNGANMVIMVSASGLVYAALNDGSKLPLTSVQNALAVLLSAIVYLVISLLVVCTVVALAEGCPPWQVWWATSKDIYLQIGALFPLGTLIVIVYYQSVWGLLLLLVPIYLAHYSFQAYQKLRAQSQGTLETLAKAVDQRDPYTFRHSERVAYYSERVARNMNLDVTDVEMVRAAAMIHDLGKVGIESAILLKAGPLDPRERQRMQEHAQLGADIIGQMANFEDLCSLVAAHQERWDGKGYPKGLQGEAIPLGARIIGVADAYEAMTADRPYRKALGPQTAIAELTRWRGVQFDPQVVDAFLAVVEEEAAEERQIVQLAPLASKQAVS